MNFIEEKIRTDGCIKSGGMLKVDSFLNHQIDMELMDEIAREFVRRFAGIPVTRVLTIETSGIILAGAVARELKVPLVIARKTRAMNLAMWQNSCPSTIRTSKPCWFPRNSCTRTTRC